MLSSVSNDGVFSGIAYKGSVVLKHCYSLLERVWGAMNFIKYSLALFMGLSLLACDIPAGIGGDTVEDRVNAARDRTNAPAIWVVRDHDSELYLFGTLHILPHNLDWFHPDIREVFDRSGTIFFEVPSDETARIEATVLTQSLGFFKNGLRLSDGFDNYQIKLLQAAALSSDVPYGRLQNLKPWLAAELLTLAAVDQAGLTADLSADEALKSRARRLQKHTRYLETVEGQIRLSADQAKDVQEVLLMDVLEGYNNLGPNMDRAARQWSVGDVDKLKTEIIERSKSRSPDFYQALFTDRNRLWADKLIKFLDGSGTGFVAVGIGHMLGEESLNNHLEEAGYSVERYYGFQGEPVINIIELDGEDKD